MHAPHLCTGGELSGIADSYDALLAGIKELGRDIARVEDKLLATDAALENEVRSATGALTSPTLPYPTFCTCADMCIHTYYFA